jgi:hypothetical protein
MAALLTDIQMSPTLNTCRVLHNTPPIVLVDSGGHLFARRLAIKTMAEPGENFVFLLWEEELRGFCQSQDCAWKLSRSDHQPGSGRVCHQRQLTAGHGRSSRRSSDIQKQFDKTSKQTMHVKRVHLADADKVVVGLLHFSEHVLDDEFVPDKQPNDDPPALPKNLAESAKSSYSISLADLPKMHRTLDHPSRSQFSHILRQALNVNTLPEDLQNAADLVHDHCVICVKSSRPVPRLRAALPSVNKPVVCASVDYGDIHHPSRGKAFRVLIMVADFSGRVYASIVDDASFIGERTAE